MTKIFDDYIVGKKESVVDEILLLNPHQTPLLNAIGFSAAVSQTEHQWYEDEMFGQESAATAAATATDVKVKVADVEPFRSGQVVRVGEELILVTAVDATAKELTIVRGHAGTVAAAIVSGDKVEVQFNDGNEGADAREARYKARTRKSNLTQIFDDSIEVTGTAAAVQQYGIADLYQYEKQKKQLELALQLEKAAINGVKYENGNKRLMGGIRSFIKTHVMDGTGIDLATKADDVITPLTQAVYEKGGFATGGRYVIMVGAKQKIALNKFGIDKIRITQGENVRGQKVEYFTTEFGLFEIVLNNNLAPDELLLVDLNRVSVKPLTTREFFHKFMGEVGDYTKGSIVGEYTLELKQEAAHGRANRLV